MAEPALHAVCYIPFGEAVFCQDCRCISNGKNTCPACGSRAVFTVARWLSEREEREQEGTVYGSAEDNQNDLPMHMRA